MKDKLYIPKRINVGFQEREGTYTGLLAYIIYWDDKGKLRKENSWNSWRHKPGQSRYRRGEDNDVYGDNVKAQEIENVPTSGFVLNKRAGGYSSGWNHRQTYCRVYDPRGFEFEISVENLLFILQECTSTKGKGLEGEFVYSWQGTELVLLPASSLDYQESVKYTSLQGKKVTRKDMVPGCSYTTKQGEELIYIGRFDYNEMGYIYTETKEEAQIRRGYRWTNRNHYYGLTSEKKHIFLKEDGTWEDSYKPCPYHTEKGFTKLATRNTEEPVDNYSDLLEDFHNSYWGSKPKDFKLEPKKVDFNDIDEERSWTKNLKGSFSMIENDDTVKVYSIEEKTDYRTDKFLGWKLRGNYSYKFKDGQLVRDYVNDSDKLYTQEEIEGMNLFETYVQLESGNNVEIQKYER
jgi:hypothetical protein